VLVKFRLYIFVVLLVLPAQGLFGECQTKADFRTWVQEGNSAYGNWTVSADGRSVVQSVDSMPTFFINNQDYINVRITGQFTVTSNDDDDFVGFVFGYKEPSSTTPVNNFDFWLISWKKTYQNYQSHIAQQGISLAKVKGSIGDESDEYYKTFWEQHDTQFFQVADTKWNLDNGWKTAYNYNFEIVYTTTKIIFLIGKDTIFNASGCFEQGRFGFFTFNQKDVKFSNLNYELAAGFDPIPAAVCKGESVLFKATCSIIPTSIVKWEWDFGDGGTSTEVNPEHTYQNSGAYDVTLKITDEAGCTSKVTLKIKVNPPPEPVIAGKLKTCAGSVDVYEGSADGNIRHSWFAYGGEISGSSENNSVRIKWGEAGSGRVVVIETDKTTGCKGQSFVNVEINNAPSITAGTDGVICRNEEYRLHCNATGGTGSYIYDWTPSEGLDDPSSTTPVLKLTEPGFYNYVATVTDSLGCTASSSVRITVREYPDVRAGMDSVYFGTILGCDRYKDTVIQITNKSVYAIKVTDIYPSPPFNLAGKIPGTINPGDSAELTIRFQPDADGIYKNDCFIVFDPCGDTLRLGFYGEYYGMSFKTEDTTDFGELIWCRDKSSSKSLDIVNTSGGSADATIEKITVSGPFSIDLQEGTKLNYNVPVNYSLGFIPDDNTPVGDVTGTIDILFQPCNFVKTLYLKAKKSDVSIVSTGSLDFGLTDYNDRPVKQLYFVNNGSAALTVNSVNSTQSNTFIIESVAPPLPADLEPGDTLTVNIKYKPGNGTETAEVHAIVDTPCPFDGVGYVSGISNLEPASITVEAATLKEKSGAIATIPIAVTKARFVWENDVRDYEVFIRFNSSLLIPRGNTPEGSVLNGERRLSLKGSFTSSTSIMGVMAEPEFTATLGNDSCTAIIIDSIRWNVSQVNDTHVDGSFCLEDLCKKGDSPRYFLETGGFGIVRLSPSPASDYINIEYRTNETSGVEIIVSDLFGREVYRSLTVPRDDHGGECTVGLTGIVPGYYILTLRTYTDRQSAMFNVLK